MSDEAQSIHSNPQEGIAFINMFFTNDAEGQDIVIQSLIQVTEEVIRHQPGFISATMHRSFDGKTVTNVARWQTVEDFKKALATPEMLAHRDVLGGQYKREGYIGHIVYTYYSEQSPARNEQLQA